jgi:hypothetical protein
MTQGQANFWRREPVGNARRCLAVIANGGCNLDDPPAQASLPQQFHLYNWSIYTGWISPDVKFHTPGSKQ